MKKLLISVLFLLNTLTAAPTDWLNCTVDPASVKVGTAGGAANEKLSFICGPGIWDCYSIGDGATDMTQSRLMLATTALVTDKSVMIRYWLPSANFTTCAGARADYSEDPKAVLLLK
jgi:hypothetical protein